VRRNSAEWRRVSAAMRKPSSTSRVKKSSASSVGFRRQELAISCSSISSTGTGYAEVKRAFSGSTTFKTVRSGSRVESMVSRARTHFTREVRTCWRDISMSGREDHPTCSAVVAMVIALFQVVRSIDSSKATLSQPTCPPTAGTFMSCDTRSASISRTLIGTSRTYRIGSATVISLRPSSTSASRTSAEKPSIARRCGHARSHGPMAADDRERTLFRIFVNSNCWSGRFIVNARRCSLPAAQNPEQYNLADRQREPLQGWKRADPKERRHGLCVSPHTGPEGDKLVHDDDRETDENERAR